MVRWVWPAAFAWPKSPPAAHLAKRSYCKPRNKKVTFVSVFKANTAQYIYNAVDKFGDKVVEKVKAKSSENQISPYLRRPLRTFADVLAERQAGAGRAAEAEQARRVVSQSPDRDTQERLSA